MEMDTTRLGDVTVTGSRELIFEHGIPGFEDLRRFDLLDLEIDLPIKLLQSADNRDISLLVGNPFHFYPHYEWELAESVQQELGITDAAELEIWSVIILPANASAATINLQAPIVVNQKTGAAKQIILHNSIYSHRHPLLEEKSVEKTSQGQVE
ncbi:flagellar assembly protein FliW [Paenibacillus xanthanilyticus]|uniref:Flagellar assembly factor FliW n=1 Tax=Paenibacillus xanthanilyticus TaxID=1783531 RepID=A0ABV8K2W5_9BACL